MSLTRRAQKPRRAKVIPCAVEVSCPDCGEVIPSPSGSLFWTVSDTWADQFCPAGCGTLVTVRLPW